MKNRERINQMNNKELACVLHLSECYTCSFKKFLSCGDRNCIEGHKAWLEQEAEEELYNLIEQEVEQ